MTTSVRSTFAHIWLTLAFVSGVANAQPAAELEILSPAAGSHLFTNRNAEILARILPGAGAEQIVAAIQLVPELGAPEILAQGNLLDSPGSDLISFIWPTRESEPGRYRIEIVLLEPVQARGSVPVILHAAPKVSLAIAEAADSAEGLLVSFGAKPSLPEGIAAARYLWTPGDGSPVVTTTEPSFSHRYVLYKEQYVAHVELQTELGGVALSTLLFDLGDTPGGWVPATVATGSGCGCEQMVIHWTDLTHSYCSNLPRDQLEAELVERDFDEQCTIAPAGQPSRCPAGTIEFACRLGPEQPDAGENRTWLKFAFEVDATVTPGSNPDLCLEGQFARADFTRDGTRRPNPTAARYPEADDWSFPAAPPDLPYDFTSVASGRTSPVPVPAFGATDPQGDPVWGADDYDAPRVLKVHEGRQVRWYDAPGLNVLADDAVGLRAEFLTFVGDPEDADPTCWCRFEIEQSWKRNGISPPPRIRLIEGLHCQLEAPLLADLASDGIDPVEADVLEDLGGASIFTAPPPPDGVPTVSTGFVPARPLVVVPGIMGSRLWKQGHQNAHLWGLTHLVWPPLNPLNYKRLVPREGDEPLVADGLIPMFYDGLIAYLDRIGYEPSGPAQTLWVYAYDWRLTNATSGRGMKALIDQILASPRAQAEGWTSVDVVNHSMGGLVTREARRQGARIEKEIYIASPHVGAPKAYVFVHPAFASGPPPGDTSTLFDQVAQGTSLLHNLKKFFDNKIYQFERDLAVHLASVYELMPDGHYLEVQGMVPAVTGLNAHYYGDDPWQFKRGTLQFSNVRTAMRYKDGLQLPAAGGPTLVIYSASEETRDTVDFSSSPVRFFDAGGAGDATVPTISGSLLRAAAAVARAGTHTALPNDQATLSLIGDHLRP